MPSFFERRILFLIRRQMPRRAQGRLCWSARLTEDLGLDYLDLIRLVGHLEQRYRIHVLDAEIDELRTVADLASCIQHRLLADQAFNCQTLHQ